MWSSPIQGRTLIPMVFLYALCWVLASELLFLASHAQSTVIGSSPCLFNSTHCSCYRVATPGTCLRHLGGHSCLVDKCSSSGFTCDCSGRDLCLVASCQTWKTSSDIPMNEQNPGESVSCEASELSGICLTKIEASEPKPNNDHREYRMIQFGRASAYSMFNMTAFLDEDNFIQQTYAMHGNWRNVERLRRRFITVRIYKYDGMPGNMLCAIYNKNDYQEDGKGAMHVEVTIKGVSGQILQWAACDDEGECYENSQTMLFGLHGILSEFADGWCVKPLESNGNAISLKFHAIHGMKGIVLQSSAGPDQEFLFGEEGASGMRGTLNKYGLVQSGEIPEILINLQGIGIPFREVKI